MIDPLKMLLDDLHDFVHIDEEGQVAPCPELLKLNYAQGNKMYEQRKHLPNCRLEKIMTYNHGWADGIVAILEKIEQIKKFHGYI